MSEGERVEQTEFVKEAVALGWARIRARDRKFKAAIGKARREERWDLIKRGCRGKRVKRMQYMEPGTRGHRLRSKEGSVT